jgi:hypothetical protein
MQDFKHLYNAEPKISAWTMLKEGLAFAGFILAAFVAFLFIASL